MGLTAFSPNGADMTISHPFGNRAKRKFIVIRSGLLLSVMLLSVIPLQYAKASLVSDQQQPIINTSAGALVIGGASQQKLAQVVTAGVSGSLTMVRFPVACDALDNLIVEIQGVTAAKPNGIVLTSAVIPGTSLPMFPPPTSFRSIVFSRPAVFSAGSQFAIVLRSTGSCVVFQGPVGNSYPGGFAFFDSLPNASGWVTFSDGGDLPFQTLVEDGGATPLIDFDGDGKSDIAVYRNGIWFVRRSFDGGITGVGWGGLVQDKPVPADYDGDGKVDYAVYRDGVWFVLRSSDGGQTAVGWGAVLSDVPVPADYDGDGKVDYAVYRDGVWFILRSSDGGQTSVGWGGLTQDMTIPADYDGDGKADIAVYRDGTWFILRSSDSGQTTVGWGGVLADIPVPADYDGDGKADIAVYRNGTWFILRSSDGGQTTVGWGSLSQDVPVPGDFDGDGKVDVAVYRNGMWFILRSSDSGQIAVGWGGAVEDVPLN